MTDRLLRSACASFVLASSLAAAGCAAVAVGKMAPPVRGSDTDWVVATPAKPFRDPASLAKNRWTLVVVFRPGSETCADEMSEILAFKKRYEKQGLTVLGVTASDREDAE